jgi:hypothetical protein
VPLFTVMMMMISYTFHWTRVSSPKEWFRKARNQTRRS